MSKENGRFEKGNEIGKETRFQKNNKLSAKYKDEYCARLLDYFAVPDREILYEEEYYQNGMLKNRTPKVVLPPRFPTFELFAASIGVVPNTLLNWRDNHPRFAEAYALAKQIQLGIAKTYGTMKEYDSNFTKFLLVNDHGMSDKATLESAGGTPFEVNIHVVR